MDRYTIGERIFLQFEVENLACKGSFELVGADYQLSVGKEILREKGAADNTISFNGNKITVLFMPTREGPNVMDIWYDINVGDLIGEGVGQNEATERRTVKYVLSVTKPSATPASTLPGRL